MFKQIHVNSYVKQDGTEVKEHYRTIDSSEGSIAEETNSEKGFIIEENIQKPDTLLSKILHTNPSVGTPGIVLTGGVSMTKFPIPILDNVIGTVLGTVGIITSVGISLLPVAAELYSAISKNNKQPVKELKTKIDNSIKQMEIEVKQMKQNLDISAKELSDTKNQQDYSKKYKEYTEAKTYYQHTKNFVDKLRIYAHNNNFKEVAETIKNYHNESSKILSKIQDNYKKVVNKANNIITTGLNNIQSGIKNNLNNANNYFNKNRPEARQFMDLAINFPDTNPVNSEYFLLQNDFNQYINDFFLTNNTNIQVTDSMKGLLFNTTSPVSKELSNSSQLQQEIRKVYAKNPNSNVLSNEELSLSQDKNLQYTIGHYTIINPTIDANGYFSGYLFDIYDFDFQKYNDLSKLQLYIFNNSAFVLQQIGYIHTYYVLIPIKFKW